MGLYQPVELYRGEACRFANHASHMRLIGETRLHSELCRVFSAVLRCQFVDRFDLSEEVQRAARLT